MSLEELAQELKNEEEVNMKDKSCPYSNIIVSPQKLLLETQEGSQFVPPSKFITLEKETHDNSPSWEMRLLPGGDWVSLYPKSGKLSTSKKQVRVSVKSIGMPAGTYKATIEVVSSSGVEVKPSPYVEVVLEVYPVAPPEPEPQPEPQPEPEPPPSTWLQQLWELIKRFLEKIWNQGG